MEDNSGSTSWALFTNEHAVIKIAVRQMFRYFNLITFISKNIITES